MGKLSTQDVGENFGVAVRVSREAGLRRDTVFVEDAQTAEGLKAWVEVGGKGEGMVRIQPAMIGMAAGRRGAKGDLCVGKRHDFLACFLDCGHRVMLWWEEWFGAKNFGRQEGDDNREKETFYRQSYEEERRPSCGLESLLLLWLRRIVSIHRNVVICLGLAVE